MSINVFISYRRNDNAYAAGRLRTKLVDEFGHGRVFFDVDTIGLGKEFEDEIRRCLSNVDVVVVLIGAQWDSQRLSEPEDFVRLEIAESLAASKPIFPVLIDGADMPVAEELTNDTKALVGFQAAPLRPDPEFDHDAERLISHIRRRFFASRARTLPSVSIEGVRWADMRWSADKRSLIENVLTGVCGEAQWSFAQVGIGPDSRIAVSSRQKPLSDDINFKFTSEVPEPRVMTSLQEAIYERDVRELEAKAHKASKAWQDDPIVEYVGVREEPEDGVRSSPPTLTLEWSTSKYSAFKVFADRLDHVVKDTNLSPEHVDQIRNQSLRSVLLGGRPNPRTIEGIGRLGRGGGESPAVSRIGVVGIPVLTYSGGAVPGTSERISADYRGPLLMGVHPSGKQGDVLGKGGPALDMHWVGGGAEPKDSVDSIFDPDLTMTREVQEEMAIEADELDVIRTGIVVDWERWQLVFCYILKIADSVSVDEFVNKRLPNAKDEWEIASVESFVPSLVDDGITQILLHDGSDLYSGDRQFQPVTNHAQAAAWCGLSYFLGLDAVASHVASLQ